ncbi:hypothetical protein ABZ471_46105, partial [Streptomyces sp. NPDC005728]
VLPKGATLPLMIGLPALLAGSVVAFRGTGQSGRGRTGFCRAGEPTQPHAPLEPSAPCGRLVR